MVQPGYFDLGTVALLRDTLDDAWASIPPKQQAVMLKTTLAQRLLKAAADGERDPDRLREAALADLTADKVGEARPVIAVTIGSAAPRS